MTQANDVLAISPVLLQQPITPPITTAPRWPAPIVGVILAATVAALWFTNLFLLGVVGPKHAEIYTDFGVALPLATEWVLDLAHFFDLSGHPASLVLLIAIPLALGLAVLMAARARSSHVRIASIVMGIVLILLAMIAFVVVPMILTIPMVDLTQQLNAAP